MRWTTSSPGARAAVPPPCRALLGHDDLLGLDQWPVHVGQVAAEVGDVRPVVATVIGVDVPPTALAAHGGVEAERGDVEARPRRRIVDADRGEGGDLGMLRGEARLHHRGLDGLEALQGPVRCGDGDDGRIAPGGAGALERGVADGGADARPVEHEGGEAVGPGVHGCAGRARARRVCRSTPCHGCLGGGGGRQGGRCEQQREDDQAGHTAQNAVGAGNRRSASLGEHDALARCPCADRRLQGRPHVAGAQDAAGARVQRDPRPTRPDRAPISTRPRLRPALHGEPEGAARRRRARRHLLALNAGEDAAAALDGDAPRDEREVRGQRADARRRPRRGGRRWRSPSP